MTKHITQRALVGVGCLLCAFALASCDHVGEAVDRSPGDQSGDTSGDSDADGDTSGQGDSTDSQDETDVDSETEDDTESTDDDTEVVDTETDTPTDTGTEVYTCQYQCMPNLMYCGERGSAFHPEMTCPPGEFCCEQKKFHLTWPCLICDENYPNGRLRQ